MSSLENKIHKLRFKTLVRITFQSHLPLKKKLGIELGIKLGKKKKVNLENYKEDITQYVELHDSCIIMEKMK